MPCREAMHPSMPSRPTMKLSSSRTLMGPAAATEGKIFDAGEGGAGECRNASNRPLAQSYVRQSPPLADKLHCSAEVGVQCTQSTRLVMDLFVKRRQSVWHWAAPAGGTLPETQQ
jgi:hypothetical protein